MLLILSCLLALALLALLRQRAEIIRLRLARRLAHVPPGSWEAFRLPRPAGPALANGRWHRA